MGDGANALHAVAARADLGARRTTKAAALLLLLVGLVPSAPAGAGVGEDVPGAIVVDGRVRTYTVHLPPGPPPVQPVPLVVGLHGAASNAADFAWYTEMDEAVEARGWLAVYPEGVRGGEQGRRTWNAGTCCAPDTSIDDVAFIAALLDHVAATHPVDPRRIYVVGHSNGGMLAYRLACELPGRIAAIAPVAAAIDDTAACHPGQAMSTVIVHGRRDRTVPYTGGHGSNVLLPVDWPSVGEATARWRSVNRCSATRRRHADPEVLQDDWVRCTPAGDLRLHTVPDGNHTWPGGRPREGGQASTATFDATAAILRFFAGHRLVQDYAPHGFVDVPPGAWCSYGLDWLAAAELMGGFADGEFRPDAPLRAAQADRAIARFRGAAEPAGSDAPRRPVTRREVAQRLFAAAGRPGGFPTAVNWARRTGVLPGYADGTFRADATVTRAQFTMALYRLAATPRAWGGGTVDSPHAV